MSEFDDRSLSLYTPRGERKYINRAERRRVLAVIQRLKRERALFSMLLLWTGGRVSEMLAVRPNSFQIERNVVALRTLKRRKPHVREVPIAPELDGGDRPAVRTHRTSAQSRDRQPAAMELRSRHRLALRERRDVGGGHRRPTRMSARPPPRLRRRHAASLRAAQHGAEVDGPRALSTTAIYADASGPDEAAFAERFWQED